ncbi:MAG: DEAD/DEAH box helicase [Fibrobacteres bacterium]|nr:DEAD/DEAH box helicase [Fibrobacterota bacterium]
MNLTDLAPQAVVDGFLPGILIEVVATVPMGPSAVNLVYKRMDTKEITTEVVISTDPRLATMQIAVDGRPWSFTAPGEPWRLAVEAKRIGLAWLFEPMMAVYTSKVDPLPHQILAVYESMLPRQPLRFLLADDPGAGKTVMAGLYIRELMLRADARRILIVAPGSLTPQWGEEMIEKFGLLFEVFDSSMIQNTATGNPFAEKERLVVRLDQLSRNPMLQEKLKQAPEYDLIVVDEAHKMSAQYWGGELRKTARFELGELLAGHCRHFLLMTATPHNGKEEDFQAFLTLLDGDRFYGKMRDGTRRVDVSDIMRRMVKEELVRFDGTPLFPDRIASTVNYKLSDDEASLYAQVTDYVRNGMNRAARLDDSRRVTVGFAMTSLQRRLASSPAAIWESLKRRKRRLEDELRETGSKIVAMRGNQNSSPKSRPWKTPTGTIMPTQKTIWMMKSTEP